MKTAKKRQQATPDKRRLCIESLIAGGTQAEAAAAAGVSKRTVQRWLLEPDFKGELETAREAAFIEALGTLKGSTQAAVKALIQNLTAKTPGERRQAAIAILNMAFKGVEVLDFEQRLEKLENLLTHIIPNQHNRRIS